MKVKRLMLIIAAVFICFLFALYAFMSFDRAGGEVEFEAVVLEISGNTIRAEVVNSGMTALSPNLPSKITFTADNYDGNSIEVGDVISGFWEYGSIKGDTVRVLWFSVIDGK